MAEAASAAAIGSSRAQVVADGEFDLGDNHAPREAHRPASTEIGPDEITLACSCDVDGRSDILARATYESAGGLAAQDRAAGAGASARLGEPDDGPAVALSGGRGDIARAAGLPMADHERRSGPTCGETKSAGPDGSVDRVVDLGEAIGAPS